MRVVAGRCRSSHFAIALGLLDALGREAAPEVGLAGLGFRVAPENQVHGLRSPVKAVRVRLLGQPVDELLLRRRAAATGA